MNSSDPTDFISRRDGLRLLGAAGLAAMFGSSVGYAAPTSAPTAAESDAEQQGAGFYRSSIDGGAAEAILISDGGFTMQPAVLFPDVPREEMEAAARAVFISPGFFPGHVNTLLVRDGDSTILVDTGAGPGMGPTAGKLMRNLARLKVKPSDITHVVITHAHPDHIGGLLDAQNKLAFPNARVVISEAEHDFWTRADPEKGFAQLGTKLPLEAQQGMIANAQRVLKAVADRIDLTKDGERIGRRLRVVAAPGHTPGHIMLEVGEGQEKLLYVSDLLHVLPLQLAHLDWHLFFDADPVAAAQTRQRVVAEIADGRRLISGAHLPFPALGHIAGTPGDYRWAPRVWEW